MISTVNRSSTSVINELFVLFQTGAPPVGLCPCEDLQSVLEKVEKEGVRARAPWAMGIAGAGC